MNMKWSRYLSIGLLIIGLHASVRAGYECPVHVTKVLIYADGRVNALHTGRNDYTVVCNLNEARQGVSPTVCLAWLAVLNQAQRAESLVHMHYPGEGSCAMLPTYDMAPAPIYIGHIK